MYTDQLRREGPLLAVDFANDSAKNVAPIIAGNVNSIVLGNGVTKTFTAGVLDKGQEGNSFTLEGWVLPYLSDEVSILAGPNGGLYWDNGLTFTVNLSSGTYSATHKPNVKKALYVAAVYDKTGLTLYVDGKVAAQTPIVSGSFQLAAPNLVAGTGTGRVAVDGMAVYNSALTAKRVLEHYRLGRDVPATASNLSQLGALMYNLEDQANSIEIARSWGTSEEWQDGIFDEVVITGSLISGEAGSWWHGIVPVSFTETIQRSRVNWRGTGSFRVQTSLDNGITWSDAEPNTNVPGLQDGMSEYNLDVRILFDGPAVVEILEVTLYTDSTYNAGPMNKLAEIVGDVTTGYAIYDQMEYREDRGARFNGGHLLIASDTGEQSDNSIYAIDMWFRLDDLSNTYVFSISTGEYLRVRYGKLEASGTVYVNGVSGVNRDVELGEWVHVLCIFSAGSNPSISVGSNISGSGSNDLIGQVGSVSIFSAPVTATDSQRIYRAYVGGRKIVVDEVSTASIIEDANAWDLYNYSWSAA